MDENDKARALKEQAARPRDFRELSYVRGHWREDQADRLVVVLEYAAARVAPEWVKTEAAVRRAEALQDRAGRARELRDGIAAAAAILAVIVEKIAGIHLGPETGHQEAVDRIYGERLIQPSTAEPSSGKAHDK